MERELDKDGYSHKVSPKPSGPCNINSQTISSSGKVSKIIGSGVDSAPSGMEEDVAASTGSSLDG